MFEAYKVAVKITLINEVTKELSAMSVVFGKLGKDVDLLQAKLNSLKKIGLMGGMALGAGFLGLDLVKRSLKPAEEYNHQLNIMNMAGLKHKEIAEATAAAWKTAHTNLTTTATGNLKTILDLRNVFGNTKEAIQYLPELARIQTVLKSSSESGVRDNAQGLAFSLAKALDMKGVSTNPREFNREAEGMTKVITALQGRVLPEDYRMLFKYGRSSVYQLSDQFLYKQLPTFMLEMKGKGGSGAHGGFGTSLYAGYKAFVQGTMNKKTAAELASLGLVSGNYALKTTTTGTILQNGVKGANLFASNPFEWVQSVLLPAERKKYGNNLNRNQLITALNKLNLTNTASFEILQFALKSQQVYRDQKLIRDAKDSKSAFKMAMSSDPTTAMAAFNAQWENFKTAMAMGVIPIVVPALMWLTKYLNEFAEIARKYPNMTRDLVIGFTALSVALVGIGGFQLTAATIGIYRLSRAIATLNGTLAAGGVGGAGASVAKAAGASAAIASGGIVAGAGLFAVGAYKLYETLKDIWTMTAKGGAIDQETARENTERKHGQSSSQPVIIQIDGRTLTQTLLPHLNQSLYHAQLQQSNTFMSSMTPTPVGSGVPYRS